MNKNQKISMNLRWASVILSSCLALAIPSVFAEEKTVDGVNSSAEGTQHSDTKSDKTEKAESKKESKKKKKDKKSGKDASTENKGDEKMVNVVIETNMGNIEVELNREKAPITVDNFLNYVEKKHYDGTIFHRVIPTFMIQGGGHKEDLSEKPTDKPIKNEADNGLKNDKYTIAMARTSVVDSATAQFFINVNDNGFLNFRSPDPRGYGYAVFGKVTSGMDVVDKIKGVSTTSKMGMDDVPEKPVTIKTIRKK